MYKFLLWVTAFFLIASSTYAGDIRYGYNGQGNYVPIEVNNQRIEYGYNGQGNYVPTSVGGEKIGYGYNGQGNYVPISFGGY